ncbi:hypothetical protein BJ165DRAFT_1485037, partial [Panaeolus papilionaceus]
LFYLNVVYFIPLTLICTYLASQILPSTIPSVIGNAGQEVSSFLLDVPHNFLLVALTVSVQAYLSSIASMLLVPPRIHYVSSSHIVVSILDTHITHLLTSRC